MHTPSRSLRHCGEHTEDSIQNIQTIIGLFVFIIKEAGRQYTSKIGWCVREEKCNIQGGKEN